MRHHHLSASLSARSSDYRRNPEKLNRNLNMAVYGEMILWSFVFLLAGAVGQTVIYPFTSTCAVRGSTVTLPCTFTPRTSFNDGQREVPLKIVSVLWCKNHKICQGTTPSVYDSNSKTSDPGNIDPRYQYLGDMKTNCTLQIRDVQQGDSTTFRFRMEADHPEGHFTNQTGVTVRVFDGTKLRIIRSSDDKNTSRGETVTLLCASVCTFHQLEVAWFKDGNALSDTGPSLRLSPLTAEDSGSYTCALKKNMKTLSESYSLQVEAGAADGVLRLVLGVVFGLLLAVILLILFIFIIKRKLAAAEDQRAVGGDPEQKHPDNIYSNIMKSVETEAAQQQEPARAVEDVSYASVQFKQKKQEGRRLQAANDDVVYSSVSSRG